MSDFNPKKIVVYGVGLLGGSFSLALRQSEFAGTIVGVSSPRTIEEAKRLGVIDEGFGYEDLSKALTDANLLILCTPINTILDVIGSRLAKMQLPDNLVITDVGSTKAIICERARELPPSVHFIGGHPMAGSEKSGVTASDPYLFQNARYVITPRSGEPSPLEKSFADFLTKHLGCRISFILPEIHDAAVATVSHMPHILSVALMKTSIDKEASVPGTFSLAAGAFRDMTRIAMSPYGMWHDIFATNRENIEDRMDAVIAHLAEIRESFGKTSLLSDWFNESGARRASLSFAGKGFGSSLSELIVAAPDRPGILAAITVILAQNDINIKDIEVMKVREGEGGTIRLGFDSDVTADRAAECIRTLPDCSVRERP